MKDAEDLNNDKSPESAAILKQITTLGEGGKWLWILFLLCTTPSIFNGLNISSYVFIGHMPAAHWCRVPELDEWTSDEVRSVSVPGGLNTTSACTMYAWNYSHLAHIGYEEAWLYVNTQAPPAQVTCLSNGRGMSYQQEDATSIVSEWDLVCENLVLRSSTQVALSIGKFLGAFTFGIIADKFGRKRAFTIGAVLYIIAGPLAAAASEYILFLVLRIIIGAAGSGVYHSAYTIMAEIAGPQHRSWMTIVYSLTYPLGMILLAGLAYLIPAWRSLQLAISVPAVVLLVHCWFVPESPRWLLSKGRHAEAYKIVFGCQERPQPIRTLGDIYDFHKKPNPEIKDIDMTYIEHQDKEMCAEKEMPLSVKKSFVDKVRKSLKELSTLYGHQEMRRRLLICQFMWCTTSFSYYALALNGDNFSADPYVYVALTGLFEVPSYFIPIPMLRWLGRRYVSFILFAVAGLSLLCILAIPQTSTTALMIVGLGGRLCVSGVFAVIILHTTELFPTLFRNSAIGTSSTSAHIGSISAPYIVDLLGAISWIIPTTICGVTALLAGLLVLLLPETKERPLCDTQEEILLQGKCQGCTWDKGHTNAPWWRTGEMSLNSMTANLQTGPLLPEMPSEKIMATVTPKEAADSCTNTQMIMTSLIAGAVAGAMAKTVIAPLDRTKINFQISRTPYSMRAAWRFIMNSYKQDGLMSLWRGNSATMARIVPYSAIQFTAHEQWKRVLGVQYVEVYDKSTNKRKFLAGALAGVTSQSMTYPLDLARARMAVTPKEDYRTLTGVFSKIYRQEGLSRMYRGFPATILGVIPYAGVSFFTYDTLKENYKARMHIAPGGMYTLLFGAAAGALGQTASYPFDIVRRRMQTARLTPEGGYVYSTMWTTIVKVYSEEGIIRGFYKGLSMNWLKGPIAVGISFATYDKIKDGVRMVIYRNNKRKDRNKRT